MLRIINQTNPISSVKSTINHKIIFPGEIYYKNNDFVKANGELDNLYVIDEIKINEDDSTKGKDFYHCWKIEKRFIFKSTQCEELNIDDIVSSKDGKIVKSNVGFGKVKNKELLSNIKYIYTIECF